MATPERRNAVALDDAFYYCRVLENGSEKPTLFKLCNAIRTLDLALESHAESPMPVSLCTEAWWRVRDSLFDILVSHFAGYFIVYGPEGGSPLEPGSDWPETGTLEFYPERSNRKNDSYSARLERVGRSVVTPMRWKFAEGTQQVSPSDFEQNEPQMPSVENEPDAAAQLIARLYEVCEEQASEGKKKAHRKWWQLYWEANSCPNKRQKHQLQKQMVALQSIWGRPSS